VVYEPEDAGVQRIRQGRDGRVAPLRRQGVLGQVVRADADEVQVGRKRAIFSAAAGTSTMMPTVDELLHA
jgi:hypothetical protein